MLHRVRKLTPQDKKPPARDRYRRKATVKILKKKN